MLLQADVMAGSLLHAAAVAPVHSLLPHDSFEVCPEANNIRQVTDGFSHLLHAAPDNPESKGQNLRCLLAYVCVSQLRPTRL